MENIKKIRIYLAIKILIFNLFLIGFFLNLIAYFGSHWIVSSENYVIGIFHYCKIFNFVEITSNTSRDLLPDFSGNSDLIQMKSTFKCVSWNELSRPSIEKLFNCMTFTLNKFANLLILIDFLKLSLAFYSIALGLHFVLLVAISVSAVSYCMIQSYRTNNLNRNIYDNETSVKIYRNQDWSFIKKRILTYLLASGFGFIIGKESFFFFIFHKIESKIFTYIFF